MSKKKKNQYVGDAINLTVLLSSPLPLPTTNPYTIMLNEELEKLDGLTRHHFTWRKALLSRYDVFHVHWPEILVDGKSPLKKIVRQVFTALLLVRMTILQTAVVRTVHNVDLPHGISKRERVLLAWMDRRIDIRIVLNTHTPVPVGSTTVLIPHGHYVDWFSRFPRSERIPGRVTYFGSIRRYKSIDQLLKAFISIISPNLTLSISGRTSSDKLTQVVEEALAEDSRIIAHLGFVDDAALTRQVSEAQLAVLPYKEMHNSGAAFAALSIGRPVLVPRNDVNQELADEVGSVWIQMYDGELTADDIVGALAATLSIGSDERPDLTARDWKTGAEEHAHAYKLAAVARGKTKGI